ncbi:MAG TPA: substrate-binding domain-containing protein [Ktedonobacteraceae bacterium]
MNKVDRRTFLKAAGGVAAGSFFFGGCGEAPAFNRGVKKTLSFWAFSDTRIKWQQHAFELYKKERNPDFEIEWLILPYNQMHDQVLVTSQAGTGGPDIADIEISQFARYIKGDVIFADLTPMLQEKGILDNVYRPSATDPWSWKGRVYGIGNELNTVLLSYRWDVWEKAKVQTPINTWDQFVEEAKRFHQDTGHYLIDFPYDDWASWWIMALQQHRGFFNAQGQPILNDPINVQTLQFQQQAIKDGWEQYVLPQPLASPTMPLSPRVSSHACWVPHGTLAAVSRKTQLQQRASGTCKHYQPGQPGVLVPQRMEGPGSQY